MISKGNHWIDIPWSETCASSAPFHKACFLFLMFLPGKIGLVSTEMGRSVEGWGLLQHTKNITDPHYSFDGLHDGLHLPFPIWIVQVLSTIGDHMEPESRRLTGEVLKKWLFDRLHCGLPSLFFLSFLDNVILLITFHSTYTYIMYICNVVVVF